MGELEGVQRRKLNAGQIEVLQLLYAFRFATAVQLGKSQGKSNPGVVHARLNRLIEQGYIGRYFEPKFHLTARPAVFYLLPKGAKFLHSLGKGSEKTTRLARKNKTSSEQFINRHVAVYDLYHWLHDALGDKLHFFAKNEIDTKEHPYFPDPLQDGFFAVVDDRGEHEFIVDVYPDERPLRTAMARLKMYTDYMKANTYGAKAGEHPVFVGIFDTDAQEKAVHKRLRHLLAAAHAPGFRFLSVTKFRLKGSAFGDAVWGSNKKVTPENRVDLLS
jgi:DNA-binding MarR family transcriptional regulator